MLELFFTKSLHSYFVSDLKCLDFSLSEFGQIKNNKFSNLFVIVWASVLVRKEDELENYQSICQSIFPGHVNLKYAKGDPATQS